MKISYGTLSVIAAINKPLLIEKLNFVLKSIKNMVTTYIQNFNFVKNYKQNDGGVFEIVTEKCKVFRKCNKEYA
jgi:hypothetical protein